MTERADAERRVEKIEFSWRNGLFPLHEDRIWLIAELRAAWAREKDATYWAVKHRDRADRKARRAHQEIRRRVAIERATHVAGTEVREKILAGAEEILKNDPHMEGEVDEYRRGLAAARAALEKWRGTQIDRPDMDDALAVIDALAAGAQEVTQLGHAKEIWHDVAGRYEQRGFKANLWRACEDVAQGKTPAFQFTYYGQERDVIFEVKEKK